MLLKQVLSLRAIENANRVTIEKFNRVDLAAEESHDVGKLD